MSEPAAEQHASIPRHIAIIMDGNGVAKQHGRASIYGHHQGVESVRKVVEACSELGVEYLTLYAFSTENWKRPIEEVNALMELLVRTIRKETPELNSQNVCIRTIGNTGSLPEDCVNELQEAISLTAGNTGLNLVLALSYSGRSELAAAMQAMGKEVAEGRLDPDTIDEQTIASHLYTVDIPDPELVIRTSRRIPYQQPPALAKCLCGVLFYRPSGLILIKKNLLLAIHSFQQRERRFGKISEQLPMKP